MRFGRFIITGVFLGLFVSAWLHATQHTQVEQDAEQAHAPSKAAPPTPSSSTAPVLGQASINLLPYGVKLTVADPITDLVYGQAKGGPNAAVGFTTESLLAKYPDCKAGALGTLVRTKSLLTPSPSKSPSLTRSPTPSRTPFPTKTPANLPFSKTVGGYVYTYKSPVFTCDTDPAGRNTVAAAVAALKNQALPTLAAQ
jgi:hypothetical protein